MKQNLYFTKVLYTVPIWAAQTDENLVLADLGSKFINSTDEWLNYLATFKIIFNYFRFIPTMDCFPSDSNFKCTKFFSKIPQLNAVGINFCMEIYWACLPPNLVIDLFKHIVNF